MRSADDDTSQAKPSLTALRVAALRRAFGRVPFETGDPTAEDRLTDAMLAEAAPLAPPPSTEAALRFRAYLEQRTRFFDEFVVNAIAGGVEQIVIVAAGYDARALRYAAPGVMFFELDHPDTQRHKRRLLDELGVATPAIEFVAVDLIVGSARAALETTSHDSSRPSAFLIEGLAVYIPSADLRRLLVDLRGVAAAASRLSISFPGRSGGDTWLGGLAKHVASLGEPIRADIDGREFSDMLADSGWRALDAGGQSSNLIAAVAA
jgi:methyltransferase (TIGR00027 family)